MTSEVNHHQEELVADLAFKLTNHIPLSLKKMDFGHNSLTYIASFAHRDPIVIRTNTNSSVFQSTEHNIAALSNIGLPVPKIAAIDLTLNNYPFAYIVMEYIDGRDLRYELGKMNESNVIVLAEQICKIQRKVGDLPKGTGFGYCGLGEKARFSTWHNCLLNEISILGCENKQIVNYIHRLKRLAIKYRTMLEAVPATCFLDDITTKNVIIKDNVLQGLIDFDCVCYGDPMWWLSLTIVCVVSDIGSDKLCYAYYLKQFYGLTNINKSLLPLYTAIHGARFIRDYDNRSGDEWLTRMSRFTESCLIEAETQSS